MNRKKLGLLLLLCCLLLSACAQKPMPRQGEALPETGLHIAAEPETGDARRFTATLYFRYADTALLRQEAREIILQPNETREKALVKALIEGSLQVGSSALFPEKTEVLSTLVQDGVVYVTFNEALYARYRDGDDSVQRRRLAMAALTATLTESGSGRAVQVLVRAEKSVGESMRLRGSYLGLAADALLEPLTRDGAYLPTPAAYAQAFLEAWQERDWSRCELFLSQRGERLSIESLAQSPALHAFETHEATVSPDGGGAVLCVELTLFDQAGREYHKSGYPLRLTREDGAWKVSAAEAEMLMEAGDA